MSFLSAVLASIFLKEHLGRIGIAGCSLCLVGSIIIVLHAPEDKMINTVDEVLGYALQPGTLFGFIILYPSHALLTYLSLSRS